MVLNKVLTPIHTDTSERIYLICDSLDAEMAGWIGQKEQDGHIRTARFHGSNFRDSQMNYGVNKKELCAIQDSIKHLRDVLQGHPVTIVTNYKTVTGFLKSLQPNPLRIRWQESQSQLDTTMDHLEEKNHVIAAALTRIYRPIKIPTTRDFTSPLDNMQSSVAQLPVTINNLTFPTRYLHIPLPTIISHTTMSSKHDNRITAVNRTRTYDESDSESWKLLNITEQWDVRTRPLTSQLQQAATANRQPLATPSAAAVNRPRQEVPSAVVVTNAIATRAQAQ